jgi:serine/threonine protein kinase/CRP-like cAMP-binding protein
VMGGASGRSAAFPSTTPSQLPISNGGGGASSFYKPPSGNDLSSLCRNTSAEEPTSGSPMEQSSPLTRRAATDAVRTTGQASEPRHTDLQAVSTAFASALTSVDKLRAAVTEKLTTVPLSPSGMKEMGGPSSQKAKEQDIATVWASAITTATRAPAEGPVKCPAEQSLSDAPCTRHVDPAEDQMGGPLKPEENGGDADKEGTTDLGETTRDNTHEALTKEIEVSPNVPQPAKVEELPSADELQAAPAPSPPVVEKGMSEAERKSESPVHNPLSLLEDKKEAAKDKDNKRPPLRSSSNRSSGSGSGSGSSAPRHRKAAAEGSATLPANAEAPNSKPDQPPLDDDESQELTMRQGHRFFSSAVQTFSHDDQAAFDNTAAANSLLSRTRGDTGGGSSSSASASHGAGSTLHVPQLRRRRSTAEMSRDKDSAGSWLEILGQSGDTSSRNSRHRGNWNTTPSLPHECPPLDSPHGTTSTGTGFTSSPPPPPLPDSVMLDEKGGMWRREGMGQRGTSAVSPKPFDEDIDLGATLRTAVVMAAAAGSSIPHHDKGAAAFSSPSGTYATQSSSQLPESSASIPFSPRKPPEENRLDLATSPSSFGLASPQSPGFVSMPTTAPTRPPRHQEPSSVVSSSIVPPTRTHNNSAAAEAVPSLSVVATQGEESSTPVTTVVSPTTQPSPSLSHKPRRELAVTSSVAVAMNSFLSREDRVSPEEVEVVREAVTHFDAFAALDETQVETLVRTMARVELQQGQTLVHEGDPTLEKLLLVVSGKLSVIRKGVVTRSFTKGQFYGEMEMSYHIERSRVMVTAVVPTVVYALTKVDYQKLVMHEKDARRYMFLQYVNQCDLFKGLSPPTKMRLADSFRVCRLRKGSKLTEQGAPVQWMYLLMSGSVRMTCKPPTSGDTPNMGPADGVGYDSPLHKAVTADSDVSAAAAATAANAVIELMNPTTNLGDTAMLASLSSTTHGPNSSYRFATTTASPPFTPFHSPSTLTQTPEGKPGTGVPELLQLAEANVYSAEMRKNSGSVSVSASPFHTLVTQQQQQQQTVPSGPQARLNSGSREENNSNSANCHTRLISTSDAFEDASPSTPPLHKAASSSPSEDHRSVATKDTDTPQRNRKRRHTVQQQQSHYDPYTVNLSGSRRVGFPATSPTSASFGSTSGSLDLAALQRCTSPSPSTTSATAKRSILSMNAAGGSGSSRRAKAASGVSADSSAKPQDALVVVDRSRGKLVGESEFVFKCKGLFTAVATTSVQAARISRLHFEAIMSRSVVEELKRNMLLNPDYYYFESTVPEELKQEMRRMLFRLNVNSSPKNRSHLALPPARRRSSYRGGSGEKSVSCIGAAMGGSIAGESNNNRSTNRHGWSRQLSCSTSLMMASQLLQRHAPRNSAVLPSSPTAKSTPKRRFRMVKVRCDTTGGGSNAEEELSSVRSANGAKPSGSPQQQRRLHRSAPLEPSPAPDSERREAASISTAGNIDPSVNGNNANGQSTLFLTATSVSSNRLVPGSSSSTGDLSPINMPMEEGSNHGGGGGGGGAGAMGKSTSGMNASVTAGRSRTGPRRNTADNLTLSAKRSSTTGSQSRRISARGEIVFSGSRNLYRFTADAMSLNEGIVIAVVVDGTIIRWNAVAQSVTGFAPFETIGKSIYDFITSEEGRQQMRDVLGLGAHYAGKWEQYVEQHLQENRLFPFRQNTGLYHVGLALSVVPSNFAKTAEVLLLVGREGKYRAANTYASEVARWLEGSLKPQLRQFQRRMMQIESHGWHVTSEDALQVKGNLDACLSMVEQFTKFSLLNMETVNESWRPVRLPVLLSRFAIEAATFARQRHHEYYCNVELVEPKTDIFLDAPQMLAILRLLLTDAFMSPNEDENGSPIVVHAELRVTVVEPHDTHPGPGGVISSPARMTTGNLGTASPTSFGAPSTANAGAVGGAKTKPAPLFGVTSSGLPSHQSNAALVMLADQLSLLPHGAPTTDPLPRVGSFQQAPSLHPTSTLASREEDAGQVTAADGEPSATGADDATSPGGGGGDTPIKSTGNTEAAGMCASLNGANTARGTMSTTASNPPTGRAATTGAVSIRGAGSPNTTVPASLSSSLRRIRFELRDDGPTILSLRSPEAVATESMRAARSPTLNLSAGSAGQSTPGTASLPMEGFPSAASSVALDGSRRTSSAPPASTYVRGAVLHQVEKIVSNLGGTVYGFTRPEAAGNVVRVELPLLAVPGANEDGREEESGMTTGGGSPFAGGSRTFTVIVADNNRAHQQQMCQILWARQHAVVPVTSFRDLVRKLEMNTADILLIDPLQIDISSDDYESLLRDDPFDEICILSGRLALVVMTSDFSDWRVQKLLNRHAVVELPKVGSGALVHIAMQEAEQLVTEMRDEEERIDLIRRTFTNCSAERHKIGKRIGKGAFGDVFEVEDTLTGGKMAMKRMRLHDGLLADEVVQEILAMTTLKHENIIQYFYCEKESDTLLRLYMELAPGGTLRDKIREHPGVSLPFEDIVHHLSDICHGLAYVHEQRYVHGDLKTANLLLGTRGRTKIGDFGTAKHLASHQLLYTMVGTPQYMAPEVLTADVEERLGYDFKADIWSLGCIVLEMATGNAPFAHLECAQGMGIIKYLTELTDTPDLSPLFSGNPLVYEFVKSCLEINPQDRPTAQELLHFDILEGAVASQRAERLVKRAEMLYKLNKYAAMRADGGGGGSLIGDGHGSNDSGHGDGHDAGQSEMLYTDEDSNATEEYDYYDEEDDGELSEGGSNTFDGADNVSPSNEEEEEEVEEGEYIDEEYEFSSSGSDSKGSDTYKQERHAAELKGEMNDPNSPAEQRQSKTTQSWQSPQEHVSILIDLMKTQLLAPHEQPVQNTVSPQPKDAHDAQTATSPSQLQQQQTPQTPQTPQEQEAQKEEVQLKPEAAAPPAEEKEEEGGEKAQENEDK